MAFTPTNALRQLTPIKIDRIQTLALSPTRHSMRRGGYRGEYREAARPFAEAVIGSVEFDRSARHVRFVPKADILLALLGRAIDSTLLIAVPI